MNKISDHISFVEATFSKSAIDKHIVNVPNEQELMNMTDVANRVFEPCRIHFGKPIKVNSFYRSPFLNKSIGGASNSQHVTGEAIDITAIGFSNKNLFQFIRDNLIFDQLIYEFGTDSNPLWIHVSYTTKRKNRNMVLRSIKTPTGTSYVSYK